MVQRGIFSPFSKTDNVKKPQGSKFNQFSLIYAFCSTNPYIIYLIMQHYFLLFYHQIINLPHSSSPIN